jgi:hypothetical protein
MARGGHERVRLDAPAAPERLAHQLLLIAIERPEHSQRPAQRLAQCGEDGLHRRVDLVALGERSAHAGLRPCAAIGAIARRHVADEQVEVAALVVEIRHGQLDGDRPALAVGGDHMVLGRHSADVRARQRRTCLVLDQDQRDRVGERAAEHLVRAPAEEALGGGVEVVDRVVGAERQEGIGRGLHDRPGARIRVAQLRLGAGVPAPRAQAERDASQQGDQQRDTQAGDDHAMQVGRRQRQRRQQRERDTGGEQHRTAGNDQGRPTSGAAKS